MTDSTTANVAPVAVVTGTSTGLGLAIARRLSLDGYAVVGIARRDVPSIEVGEKYEHVQADLSDLDAIPNLARQIIDRYGAPYALINNAAGAIDGILPNLADRNIRASIGLDLVSPVLLTKYLVRPMISRRVGRVVNVSSIVASTGFTGLSVYGATKAGLVGFTRSLARDVGSRGVTVNAVAPGFLDTSMTGGMDEAMRDRVRRRSPAKRFATVHEVAAAVAHLVSPDASGITGTVMTVDAGATA